MTTTIHPPDVAELQRALRDTMAERDAIRRRYDPTLRAGHVTQAGAIFSCCGGQGCRDCDPGRCAGCHIHLHGSDTHSHGSATFCDVCCPRCHLADVVAAVAGDDGTLEGLAEVIRDGELDDALCAALVLR